jgi:hypothetical protein
MVTLHIDDINKKANKKQSPPGPGTYEAAKTFGKEGESKSFAALLPYDHISLKRAKDLPGPGQYMEPDVLGRGIVSSLKSNSVG